MHFRIGAAVLGALFFALIAIGIWLFPPYFQENVGISTFEFNRALLRWLLLGTLIPVSTFFIITAGWRFWTEPLPDDRPKEEK